MNDEVMVKMGRKPPISLSKLKEAVANTDSLTKACNYLGWSHQMKDHMENNISKYNLDNSHHKHYHPNARESKAIKERGLKSRNQYELNTLNEEYFDTYLNSIDNEDTKNTYRSPIGNFIKPFADRDFATIKISELVEYSRQAKNIAPIKSFIKFLIENNVNNFYSKVDKSILAWIVYEPNLPAYIFEDIAPSDNKLFITENKKSKGHNTCQYCGKEFPATSDYWMLAQFSEYGELFVACRECEGKDGKITY